VGLCGPSARCRASLTHVFGSKRVRNVEDAPGLQSHAVDLFSPGSDVTGAALSRVSRNLAPQRLCRVWLFFVVPGCARASSSSLALAHSSSSFTERSLDSEGMVPRIWNNIWRFSGCPSAGPKSKARDTRATYLRLNGGCSGCCCAASCWAACQ